MIRWFVLLGFCSLLLGTVANASGIEWSGVYRAELNSIHGSELDGEGSNKEYLLHHLTLRPKIAPADGLLIYGRFDIFNEDDTGQVGQTLGASEGVAAHLSDSDTAGDSKTADTLLVSQLYLTYSMPYGQFIVGRTPYHFGLGMSNNAGKGAFDKYFDVRDMVGFKMVFGNIYLFPSYSKLSEGRLNSEAEDQTEYAVHFQYNNPGTDLEMGVLYQMRRGGNAGNDTPTGDPESGAGIGGTGATANGSASFNQLGLYVKRDRSRFKVALEAAFKSGKAGINTIAFETVKYDSNALAMELELRPQGKSYRYGAYAGFASGDNLDSDNNYEGFAFDRNYDIAMLMFNHQLGAADFLQTGVIGGGSSSNGNEMVDVEAISNVTYFAPYFNYQMIENVSFDVRLVTGQLRQAKGDGQKNLGYELDLGFNYKPHQAVQWINQLGYFAPGKAFEGASTDDYSTKSAFGFVSKLAVSF